jgi:hypothetical protein
VRSDGKWNEWEVLANGWNGNSRRRKDGQGDGFNREANLSELRPKIMKEEKKINANNDK